jgi:hypothetical protein
MAYNRQFQKREVIKTRQAKDAAPDGAWNCFLTFGFYKDATPTVFGMAAINMLIVTYLGTTIYDDQ